MMMGSSSSSSSSNLNPNVVFTAAQWEELEQQALIYKYMVSGVPVPTDLLLSVRRSLYTSTFASSSSSSLSHHPTLGMWEGSFQYNQLYGYGRKIDLEPGRCRRTDGKKWRCSKEAYPDSKYCEKHMHRGRNRSRKPVELSSSSSISTTTTTITTTATNVNVSLTPSVTISKSLVDTYPQLSTSHASFMDYRYLQGMKDLGDDERSAYNSCVQQNNHKNYSQINFQNLKEQQQNKEEETQLRQHCFVMGTDFIKSSEEANKLNETTSKQPFHHFFATPKTTTNTNHEPPNWVDVVDQQHHIINPPKSPLSTQDLFESKPRPFW